MRVLIIADESFSSRERAMLGRLEVGLADERVRVIHAVPRSAERWQGAALSASNVWYEDRGMSVSRRWRARRLLEAARGVVEAEPPFDLVHAFGAGCWGMAQDLAREAGAGLVLEIFSVATANAAARERPSAGAAPAAYFLPDPALEKLVRAGDVGVQVRLTPWGVHTPPGGPTSTPREGRTAMIVGGGSDAGALASVITALADVAPESQNLLTFADEAAVREAGVWPQVRKLKLADRFTIAPDVEARRELTLRADMLLLPEARGEHRSLTLDAMAAGMLVLAAQDPYVPLLSDGRTARLVQRPAADAWAEALRWALSDSEAPARLAAAAREHVRQNCRASAHVAAVLGGYEWMTASAIPFVRPS
jgi:hypothetical protein